MSFVSFDTIVIFLSTLFWEYSIIWVDWICEKKKKIPVSTFYFYHLVPIVMQKWFGWEIWDYYVLSEEVWKQLGAKAAYISHFFFLYRIWTFTDSLLWRLAFQNYFVFWFAGNSLNNTGKKMPSLISVSF